VRRLLRTDDIRGGLSVPVARTLHRIARTAKLRPTEDERIRLSSLLKGAWVVPVAGAAGVRTAVELHPDVRFSLALDEGYRPQRAQTTLHGNRLETMRAAVSEEASAQPPGALSDSAHHRDRPA
jgi:hypothetical protein